MTPTLSLAMALMEKPSVTPDDAGCQPLLAQRLQALGFVIEPMPFGDVSNLWARLGNEEPVFVFAGHTDVVPPGQAQDWLSEPFAPVVRDGMLYGRGAADMKGSIAAMVVACERFLASGEPFQGSIAFLITSDEEGVAADGTRRVMEVLESRGEKIHYCIVGEPSSSDTLGDVIKIGRRGSLHGLLTVHGVQGHVAYPHLASNPIHKAMAPLHALASETWDEGNEAFPPTSFQISNISSGTGADNVIPGTLHARFNFRFSTELTQEEIQQRTQAILDDFELEYSLEWQLSGNPFLTRSGTLIDAVKQSIRHICGVETECSTSGGTSDGRFIAPSGAQLLELGPCNATIHKVNEHVSIDDLETLTRLYEDVMTRLLRA
ncbi:MAG: succinyl-diaminopimelate desuccinylase [Pseudomonadales bacterium]|nr:succinyl-diaminopimelate desuccinylase [Pseudomonadales bacterium]MCP5331130.1 succinyl-diaminopimelate desuccinylase [Pseudomonadales bacterium]MCP5343593.1 succinyl-diaminopimelate desuccinylase [Pseudomonadales bacterium]